MSRLSKKSSENADDRSFDGIPSFVDRKALLAFVNQLGDGLHGAEFEPFYEEFVTETDRAAVILGAAKIDDILSRILVARLVCAVDEKSDELLSANAPLGTMSARIDMVFRLGLISKDLRRFLHLIRKVRNTFAHDLEGCSFETPSVKCQTQELYAPYESRLFTKSFMRRFGKDDSSAVRFRTVLAIHMHRLNMISQLVNRINGEEAYPPLMPNWERLKEKGFLRDEDIEGFA